MDAQDMSSDIQCISDDDDLVLRDVVAVVEVRTKTENRSRGVQYQLEQLGAKVVSKLSDDVTHLIWKNGKKPTLERARKKGIHIVSVLWVESCKQNQEHVAEEMFHVSTKEEASPLFLPRTREKYLREETASFQQSKRRKFMEPKPLEEDLQDSRERLAKRRKREVPSPLSVPGRVLVKDTPFRHSPTWYLPGPPFSPSLIPNTPDSMRACLDKLNAIRTRSPLDHAKPCLGDSPTCGTFNSSGSGHSSPLERPDVVSSLIDRLLHSDDDEPSPLEKICLNSKKPDASHRTKTKSSKVLFQSDVATNHKEKHGAPAGEEEIRERPEHSPPVPAPEDVKSTTVEKGKQVPFSKESQMSSTRNQQTSMEKCENDEIQTEKGRSSRLSRRFSGAIVEEQVKSSSRKGLRRRYDGKERNLDDRTIDNVENDSDIGGRHDSISNVEEESVESIEEPATTGSQSNKSKLYRRRSSRCKARSSVDKSASVGNCNTKKVSRTKSMGDKRKEVCELNPNDPSQARTKAKQDTIMDITNLDHRLEGSADREEAEIKSAGRCKQLSRKSKGRSSKVIQSELGAEIMVLDSPEDQRGGGDVEVNRDEASKKENGDAGKKERRGIQKDGEGHKLQEERNTPGQKRMLSDTCGGDIERRKPKRRRLLKMQTFNEPPSILIEPKDPLRDTAEENSTMAAILKGSPSSMAEETGGGDCNVSRKETEKTVRGNKDSGTEVVRTSRRSVEEFQEMAKKGRGKRRKVTSGKTEKDSKSSSGESGPSGDDSDGHIDKKKDSSGNIGCDLTCKQKTKKRTIVMTSMHRSDQDIVVSVVRSLGGYKITDSVSATTTHVVTGDHRRTLNVLSAIAHGCWLLSKEWVLNSLESGCWLPEEPFEVHSTFPAAKISRKLKSQSKTQNTHLDLFSELGPIFVGDSTSPPKERLSDLLLLCGASLCKDPGEARLCVGDCPHPAEVRPVKEKWVLDCISEIKTLPIEGYLI